MEARHKFSAVSEWWHHLESHQLVVGSWSLESKTGWMVYLEQVPHVVGITKKSQQQKQRNFLFMVFLNIYFTETLPECVFGASRWRASHEDDSLSARVCRKRVCRWHGPLGAFVKGLVFTLGGHLLHCQAHMPFNGMDPTKFRRAFVCFAASVCWDGSAPWSWNWCHRSVGLPEPTRCLVSFRDCHLYVGGSESWRSWCQCLLKWITIPFKRNLAFVYSLRRFAKYTLIDRRDRVPDLDRIQLNETLLD